MSRNNIKVAPSILSADFSKLGEHLLEIEKKGADLIHIDVMDGHFVPNLSIGPAVVESIRPVTSLLFDVHLMVSNPEKYASSFIKAGADMISFHVETLKDPLSLISSLKHHNIKAGIAINPDTPYKQIKDYVKYLDFILVMSVFPGFSGQSFIEKVLDKVREIKQHFEEENLNDIEIEIDGGINGINISKVIEAGVDIVVAGSYIFKGDIAKNIASLKG